MLDCINSIIRLEKKVAVGIMSGTSLDGIDIAFCKIEGSGYETKVELIAFDTVPFNNKEKEDIIKACSKDTSNVMQICLLNKYLGVRFGEAVLIVAKKNNIDMNNVDFVSSHGQTIFHIPEENATLQIGELADIAAITGKVCVGDFRPSDMAYGGEGAPLVPFVDYCLFHSKNKNRGLLNIGGISNITVLQKYSGLEDVFAFDLGPGNMLIDEMVRINSNFELNYDKNGELGSKGYIDHNLLNYIKNKDSFPEKVPPKSTGRELYSREFAKEIYDFGLKLGLDICDIVATVTEYTAYTIDYGINHYVNCLLDEIYISGGGVHNKFLMERLKHYQGDKIMYFSELGMDNDAKEAVAFAVLGNEFLHGNYNNSKKATNADRDVIMGKLVLPSN